jgi:5-methylcytosine-specific restriction endonuclease McrA
MSEPLVDLLAASTRRVAADKGRAAALELKKGGNGRCLCRWCGLEVPRGRRTFCSPYCVHEWRLRTDPGYVRLAVWERDHGVCAECGRDTKLDIPARRRRRAPRRTGHLWQADHIKPVVEGGGECGLENYRTLCTPSHRAATASLAARRALTKLARVSPEMVCDLL